MRVRESEDDGNPAAAGTAGLVGVVVGLIALVAGVVCGWQQWRALSWPMVKADQIEIVAAQRPSGYRETDGFRLRVEYAYRVGSRQYRSTQYMPGQWIVLFSGEMGDREFETAAAARAEAERGLAAGGMIHYDPADPQIAAVRVGLMPVATSRILFGLGMLLSGVGIMIDAIPFYRPPVRLRRPLMWAASPALIGAAVVWLGEQFVGWEAPVWVFWAALGGAGVMAGVGVVSASGRAGGGGERG